MAFANGVDIPMAGRDAGLEHRKVLRSGLESKNGCRQQDGGRNKMKEKLGKKRVPLRHGEELGNG